MTKNINLKLNLVSLHSFQSRHDLEQLAAKLDKAAKLTHTIFKPTSKDYIINTLVNGHTETIRLHIQPFHLRPFLIIAFELRKWDRRSTRKIISFLATHLGDEFLNNTLKRSNITQIEVMSDLPPSINPQDITLTYGSKTRPNVDGRFPPIHLTQFQAAFKASAYRIDSLGEVTKNKKPASTRFTLTIKIKQSQGVRKLNSLYKAVNLIKIRHVIGLARVVPKNTLQKGYRSGLETATADNEVMSAIYNGIFKNAAHLHWPTPFHQYWQKTIKPITYLVLTNNQRY